MTPGSGANRRQRRTSGAHRALRKRSVLTRTVAAGGAVVCIGAAYEATAPTVHALSIVFYTPQANGTTNELRVDLGQSNIFDPQLGILGGNVSNNSTTGNGAIATSHNFLVDNPIFNNPIIQFLNSLWNRQIVFGPAAAGPVNNITQISLLSFNIFNPQASIFGGNLSHNTTNSNIAVGYGNYASATSIPNLWTSWFGGLTGNGNAHQLAFLSGNIFNPQASLFGPNVSNNTAVTNVANYNGNYSQTSMMQGGGLLGAVVRLFLGGTTGNGNTTQTAVGTSNIANPQISIGGSNQSNNTANTNEAVGNGNNSQTTVGAPNGSGNVIATGTTGNGNTTQTAVDASNIENPQVSLLNVGHTPTPAPALNPGSAPKTTSTSTASTGTPTSGLSAAGTHSITGSSGSPTVQTGSTGASQPSSGSGSSGTAASSGSSGSSGEKGKT